MATSGFPYILDASGNRPSRATPGDVLTGTQGTYIDTDGMVAGSVRVNFWWGEANLLQTGPFGNEGITDQYIVTEDDVGKHLYVTYQYTRDDGGATIVQPFSGSIAVEPAYPALRTPQFNRKATQEITDAGPQGRVYNFTDSGNYLYAAANNDGIYVWDISDPANPVYLRKIPMRRPGGATTTMPVTDVKIYPVSGVDHLFVCARRVEYTFAPDPPPETGIFACYDLVDPENPSWQSSYQPPDMSPIPTFAFGQANSWYQGMSYNPDQANVVNVASQLDGHTAMDVSNPAAVAPLGVFGQNELAPLLALNPTWKIWECSNCSSFTDVNGELWVVYPNHGNGVYLVNVTIPTAPTDVIWLRGFQPFRLNGTEDVNQARIQCRYRMSQMVGTHVFMCFNTATLSLPARGICSLNLADPYTVPAGNAATDAWRWSPIGIANNDEWNGAGDAPQMGLTIDESGLYAYIANGQKGTSVFDIRDRDAPRYLGDQGTALEDRTNLYQSYSIVRNGRRYQYYSDAYDALPQQNYLYVDEVNIMPFEIGNDALGDTTMFVTPNRAQSAGLVVGATRLAQLGDYVDTLGVWFDQPGAPRDVFLQLHEVDTTPGSEKPTTPVGPVYSFTMPASGGVGQREAGAIPRFNLTPGTTYCVVMGQDGGGGNSILQGTTTTGERAPYDDGGATGGVFADPFVVTLNISTTNPSIFALGDTAEQGKNNPVIGGVGDSTTTPARDNSGDVAITPVGGVSSSIIGACPNEAYSEGPIMTEYAGGRPTTMAADHVFRYIGGGASTANETGSPSGPDTEVTHEARIYDAETDTFGTKAIRQVLANDSADPYAPGAAVAPSTFLNDTNPEEDVEAGEGVFGVEP